MSSLNVLDVKLSSLLIFLSSRRITVEKERNPAVICNSDSDSDDGDSFAKLRDYYGNDEQGRVEFILQVMLQFI